MPVKPLRLAVIVLFLACVPVQAETWWLAMTWAPGFCATHAGKQQCQAHADPQDFANRHLTLHGLWPARQNCPAPPLRAQDLPPGLAQWMPGIVDGLAEHEWRKHGSCSGMTAQGYFAQMLHMAEEVDASHLGRYLNAHAGMQVSLRTLHAIQAQDAPAGQARGVRFLCQGARLQEVRFALQDSADMPDEAVGGPPMLAPDQCDDAVQL